MTMTRTLTGATLTLALTAGALGQISSQETAPGVRMDVEATRARFLQSNDQTNYNVRDGIITRVYGKSFASGDDAVDSATNFVNEYANMFGIESAELLPIGPNADGTHALPLGYDRLTGIHRFTLVAWTQALDGIPVFNGSIRVLVRNEPGFPVVLVSNEMADMRDYDGRFAGTGLAPTQLDPKVFTRHAANQFFMEPVVSGVEQVIWAGEPGAWLEEPILAVKFIGTGGTNIDPDNYQKFKYVVDARNGRILYQENMILDYDVSGQVTARVTEGDASDDCGAETYQPLPYARLQIGGSTVYADANGTFVTFGGGAQTVTSTVSGRYYVVNDQFDGGVSTITEDIPFGGFFDFQHNASNANEYDRAEVNAYLWANITRDWALSHFPNMPQLSTQTDWPININLSQSCNAYYDYSSINFYTSGNGCPNTAFSDVVAHELGHHFIAICGSGQGQYGEGGGDVNGILLTREPTLGNGFLGNCGQGIRTADNDYQYPQDDSGGIHNSGQLLSGSVWDLVLQLGGPSSDAAIDIASFCWVNSICLHTGTQITPDITIDFMTIDDNDGNILNGTPNYTAINTAFGLHNMPGPDLALIDISLPDGAPGSVAPSGSEFEVQIQNLTGTYAPGSGELRFRTGTGGFASADLVSAGGDLYTAALPSADCGQVWDFYVYAETTDGVQVTLPSNAPGIVYSAPVATGFETILDVDFETNPGWTVSGVSGAGVGQWAIGTPCGTTTRGAPGEDFDGSGQCYLTGLGACDSNTDVDDGCATLTTAMFSAVNSDGEGDASVSYALWYDNTGGGIGADPSNDIMTVEISTDGGASWTNVETIGPLDDRSSGGWFVSTLQVSTYGTPSANCMMRFEACDANSGSVIEAAIDAFNVEVVLCDEGCPAGNNPGDTNADGVVDGTDLSNLLGFWGSNYPEADFNCDGTIDGTDLSVLLGAWTIDP